MSKKAIRSLLGLGTVETALRHIDNTSRSINRKAKDAGAGGELENVASELERVNDDIEQHQKALAIAQEQNEAYSTRIEELAKQISDVLIKGDKRDLDRRLTAVRQRYAQATKDMDVATKKHSDLFNGMELSRDIMGEPLQQIIDSLDELRQRGPFPQNTHSNTQRAPQSRGVHLRRIPCRARQRRRSQTATHKRTYNTEPRSGRSESSADGFVLHKRNIPDTARRRTLA